MICKTFCIIPEYFGKRFPNGYFDFRLFLQKLCENGYFHIYDDTLTEGKLRTVTDRVQITSGRRYVHMWASLMQK